MIFNRYERYNLPITWIQTHSYEETSSSPSSITLDLESAIRVISEKPHLLLVTKVQMMTERK